MKYYFFKKQQQLDIMEVPEGGGWKGQRAYFKKIVAENFSYLGRDLDLQVHKAHWLPTLPNFNPKWFSAGHIIIKLSKIKDRVLKGTRGKKFSHSREPPKGY